MSEVQFPRGKYRLTMKSHMPRTPGGDPEMLEPGTEIEYEGRPGPHMVALNDDALVAKAMAGEQRLDPDTFNPLEGDEDDRLAIKIADGVTKAMAVVIPQIITAVMEGIAKAQQPAKPVSQAPPPAPPVSTAPPPPPPPPPPAAAADPKAGKGK